MQTCMKCLGNASKSVSTEMTCRAALLLFSHLSFLLPARKTCVHNSPWNSRRREELAEASEGKPLGSRVAELFDFDFSF
jgi:hypothetical protein